jgi:hypothetical protein
MTNVREEATHRRTMLFQLDDRLIRFHVLALGDKDGNDLAIKWCRHAAFHLHRFDDQERLAGFDPLVFCDEHLHDPSRHGWRDIAGLRRLRSFRFGIASAVRRFRHAGQHLLDGLQRHFLQLVVDTDVVGFSSIRLTAGSRHLHVVGFTVNGEIELDRREMQFASDRRPFRRRCFEGFRNEIALLARLEEVARDSREQDEGQLDLS